MSPWDALVVLGRRQCAPATARGARARLSIERARERVARIFSRVSFANAVDAEAPTREETPETPWGFDFGAKPRPRRARRIVGEGCLKRPRGRRSPRRSERSRRACGAPRDALVFLGRRQCAPATARGARARLSIERARERVARIFSRVSFANAVDAEAPTREETPETPWGFDFGAKPRPRRARRIVGEGCLKRPRGRRSPRRSERSRRACGAGARGA